MGLFSFLSRRETSGTAQQQKAGAVVPSRRVYVNNGDRAMKVAAFYHALDLRAKTAARAVLRYERFVGGSWKEDDYGSNRRLNWLLQVRPNELMTALQFWEYVYRMRDIEGCAGIYIDEKEGEIFRLIPVRVSWNSMGSTFIINSDEFPWVNGMSVSGERVLLIKGVVTPGYMLGRSLLHYAKDTLSLAATAESLCLDVMSKGGTFRAIVKQEQQISGLQGLGNLDDNEVKKNTDSISEQFAEGKDFIFDPSASNVTPITQSFQDLQVDLQRNKAVEDIARFAGVPLPLMFCATNAVYKSIDDAWHTFLELTIKPMLEEVAQELNAKLLEPAEFGKLQYRFDVSGLCLDSDKSKAETAQIYVNSGIKTRNEVREEMNLEPLPDNINTDEL
jgi:HK97 family phage portal protein